jgi:hypothetical protein
MYFNYPGTIDPVQGFKQILLVSNCSMLLHCVGFAVYVQRRLIFSHSFLFIVSICFGLTGHYQQSPSSQQPVHLMMAG